MQIKPSAVLEALQQRATRDKELALHLEAAILQVALDTQTAANGADAPLPELVDE